MSEWFDATAHNRKDMQLIESGGEVEPRTMRLSAGGIVLNVTRHSRMDPKTWFCRCSSLGLDMVPLARKTLKAAQKEALGLALERTSTASAAFQAALENANE